MTYLRVLRISIHAPRVGRDRRSGQSSPAWCNFNPRAPCGARHRTFSRQGRRKHISIHAPRVGRDARSNRRTGQGRHFNPRAPCGARQDAQHVFRHIRPISIHAPRVGRDRDSVSSCVSVSRFQSTRPVWGATSVRPPIHLRPRDFNPRAPCGARLMDAGQTTSYIDISIHAPRVGRDAKYAKKASRDIEFQSTRPVWGATARLQDADVDAKFQSTRPVWGATYTYLTYARGRSISIHAPRVGRDSTLSLLVFVRSRFQSTRPVWGATRRCRTWSGTATNFNPRAPCGARRYYNGALLAVEIFQSTRPVWGATVSCRRRKPQLLFQSTRPVWGATTWPPHFPASAPHFNPRAPCGARPCCVRRSWTWWRFQSTRPVWGATMAAVWWRL